MGERVVSGHSLAVGLEHAASVAAYHPRLPLRLSLRLISVQRMATGRLLILPKGRWRLLILSRGRWLLLFSGRRLAWSLRSFGTGWIRLPNPASTLLRHRLILQHVSVRTSIGGRRPNIPREAEFCGWLVNPICSPHGKTILGLEIPLPN